MKNLFVTILIVIVAMASGYYGGRLAQESAPRVAVTPPPPPAEPKTQPPIVTAPVAPPIAPATAGNALSGTYRSAVERAAPSVFTVHSARTMSRGALRFGGQDMFTQGLGSGVLLDNEGHVLTNNHVVQDATQLAVVVPDGTLRQGRLIGTDPDTDLALLRIDPKGLKPIAIGNVKELAVGDVVLAVGNPLGVGQTVTQGIVSAVGRKGIGINPIENFIQTDAAINPGNSGGALVDTSGRLVGINTAILSRGGGSEGIGFAIPIDLAQQVVASLQKSGRVTRGYLGVSTALPRGQKGALVSGVQRGGPADRAGVEPGDVIVRLGEREIAQPDDLLSATLELEPGRRVAIDVVRDGRRQSHEVELGRRPPLRRVSPPVGPGG
ncbi:MAG TPA: trypsin-like peptidase domain-containing protein [Casimicrobiaceae bacterium]|nr:trypsin-like peptidase domain-containing protein [Casimicrobiaceae bacterium]